MAATLITKSARYFRRGKTKVYFLTIASDYTSPTRAELNAGTDLSREIAAISGWNISTNAIKTPDLGSTFDSSIPGGTSMDDSSLDFYADSTSVDVRTLLARGTTGIIVWLDEGDVAGHLMDSIPVQVGSAPKQRTLDDNAATIQVQFYATQEPAENVAVPA